MTQAEQTTAPNRTSLARPWLVRMVLITVVLVAFGGWGLVDATVKYPARGRRHAEALQLDYLRAAERSGRLFEAAVFDPKGDLTALKNRDVLELSEYDRAKRDWLEALDVPGLGLLNADYTRIADPAAELNRLTEYFNSHSAPPALSNYDILMQWMICIVCWGIAAGMIVLFLSVSAKKFVWDPASRTLTMPGGRTIAPADLDPKDPADLAKWHKFIIFLRPREGHERLSGPIKLDLFRYHPLEDWIRELVKGAAADFEFPDEAKARVEAAAAAAEGEDEAVEEDPTS